MNPTPLPTRYEHLVGAVAVELRAFAERHLGKRISHFVAFDRLVFVTCRRHGMNLEWELRVARYGEKRPAPFSLAEENFQRYVRQWRDLFAVPPGASVAWDPNLDGLDDPRGYAVLITWTETDSAAALPQRTLL